MGKDILRDLRLEKETAKQKAPQYLPGLSKAITIIADLVQRGQIPAESLRGDNQIELPKQPISEFDLPVILEPTPVEIGIDRADVEVLPILLRKRLQDVAKPYVDGIEKRMHEADLAEDAEVLEQEFEDIEERRFLFFKTHSQGKLLRERKRTRKTWPTIENQEASYEIVYDKTFTYVEGIGPIDTLKLASARFNEYQVSMNRSSTLETLSSIDLVFQKHDDANRVTTLTYTPPGSSVARTTHPLHTCEILHHAKDSRLREVSEWRAKLANASIVIDFDNLQVLIKMSATFENKVEADFAYVPDTNDFRYSDYSFNLQSKPLSVKGFIEWTELFLRRVPNIYRNSQT